MLRKENKEITLFSLKLRYLHFPINTKRGLFGFQMRKNEGFHGFKLLMAHAVRINYKKVRNHVPTFFTVKLSVTGKIDV